MASFLWPVPGHYAVSSGFDDPRGYGPHNAIDIPAPSGAPIIAIADGKVAYAGMAGDCGLALQVEHAGGWRSHYCHLSLSLALTGEIVDSGEQIGKVGNTGASLGPHLHINLFSPSKLPGSRYVAWVRKYAVDPLLYLLKEADMEAIDQLAARVAATEKAVEVLRALMLTEKRAHVLRGLNTNESTQQTKDILNRVVRELRAAADRMGKDVI